MIQLKPHQLQAVQWLRSHNGIGCLYMDAGTGKTFCSLQYAKEVGAKQVLVFTLASTIDQWREEIKRYFGDDNNTSFSVFNYEKLLNDALLQRLMKDHWDIIIADESEKIKNPMAKSVKRFMKLQAPRRICLSATPNPNNLHELWSCVNWFSPGILEPNFFLFKTRWCQTNPYIPQQIIGYVNKERLLKILQPFFYRITDEVLNLPEAHRTIKWIELEKEEQAAYNEIYKESIITLKNGDKITIPNLLTQIIRLLQFVNDWQVFGQTGLNTKQKVLQRILAESSEKTIIFSDFATICKRSHKLCGGALLVGEMNIRQRKEQIEKFKNDPECKYLWSSAAGSRGLNLTVATRIIHLTLPAHNAALRQRLGRSRRLLQTHQVKEIFLIAKNTVEIKIWNMIERKKKLETLLTRKDYKDILNYT